MVEAGYPLTMNIEYHKYLIDSFLTHFSKTTFIVGKNVFNKSYYKDLTETFINEALKLESKPFKEIRKEYEEYGTKIKKIKNSSEYINFFPNYLLNPEKVVVGYTVLCTQGLSNLYSSKLNLEEARGYMEFAAIALLINSYYCQNGNLPQNMEELEKWFGQKLPVSRSDYKPYDIDTKGKHLLTYKYVNEGNGKSQLYFDFSK